ncbi:MAG: hypothetical protein EP344_19200 [Bacteroidetes bacterium]|nr:MAG: hypothetical protein EP344_19200 [Bacteroidota bacterium]
MKTKPLLYLLITCTIPLGYWAVASLPFETDIRAYNLAADADIQAYESIARSLERVEGSETVLVLEKASCWRTLADFRLLKEIIAFWEAQHGITQVSGLTNLPYPKSGILGPQTEPFLDLERPERFQKRMEQSDRFTDIFEKFLSKDQRYTLLFVTAPNGIPGQAAQALEQLSALQKGIAVHYIQYDLIRDELQSTVRRDTIVLAVISLCLILAGFYTYTRSLRGLALTGLLVTFNIAVTFLVMHALSMSFTVHMVTIPCIITVLSFTDIMHILYHQQTEHAAARTDRELQRRILSAVRTPLFLTSATNMVGFLLFLLFSENVHLTNFSLSAIAGVAIAYLSARFLVIRLMGKERVFIKRTDFRGLYRVHHRISRWFWYKKNSVLPAFITAAVLLVVLVGATLSIDSSEQEYALSGSKLTKGKAILEQAFFGAKQAEVFLTLREGSVWDKATLDQLEQVEAAVQDIFHPLFINSPGVLVKRYHRFLSNGNPAAYSIPTALHPEFTAGLHRYKTRLGGAGIVDSTATRASIIFGFDPLSLQEARKRYAALRKVLREQSTAAAHYELSGLQYLSDEATHRFSLRILTGLVLSIVFGSVLVFVLLHSFRKSAGLLLVNLFPLFAALGVMLHLGIPVTPLTLFFLSILLGICVDDSIYLIAQNRKKSGVLHIVPVFITSMVLSLGFLSLACSSFDWLRPFGWIFLSGIALAYLSDLFILPLFLNRQAVFGDAG